jgi:putative endonuclease
MKRHEIGNLGERIAVTYLKNNGYDILETNYRCPYGEIDIIARNATTLVFVEVRTKTSYIYGTPEESITRTKMKHLLAVADHYTAERPDLPEEQRIDVIAIRLDPNGQLGNIEHIENAVEGH